MKSVQIRFYICREPVVKQVKNFKISTYLIDGLTKDQDVPRNLTRKVVNHSDCNQPPSDSQIKVFKIC